MPSRIIPKVRKMRQIVHLAEDRFKAPSPVLWFRLLQRHAIDQFSLNEISEYALLAPEILANYPVLISKEASLKKLYKINNKDLQWQTENKEKFYEICASNGIRHPKVFAILGKNQQVWKDELPQHFICKDVNGAYGSGFAVFERMGKDHVAMNGGAPEKLSDAMDRLTQGRTKLLLQERLFDHPELQKISGRPTLQTLRITTFHDPQGHYRLLYWFIKLVMGSNYSDNFASGKSGNLIAFGAPDNGTLQAARTLDPSGFGLNTIFNHPESNRLLSDFTVPLWQDAINTALEAHRFFPDFKALGWDIAITPDGPKVIEANAWWDPPRATPHLMQPQDWQTVFG